MLISLCLGSITHVAGQTDAHYWTHQYGAKGLLMNGAVIADPSDETSLFYNPGAMGKSDNVGFAFSFFTPTLATLSISNLLGDEGSYNDTSFDLAPGFLAVRLRPFNNGNITLGIASFQRLNTELSYRDRKIGLSSDTPQDIFRSEVDFNRSLSQSWHGIGISWNVTDRLGIGITQFSVWHNESFNLDIKRELYARTTPNSLSVGIRSRINYDISIKSSFLSKVGMAYEGDTYRLGMTFTSPIYGGIRKRAEYLFDYLTREERRETEVSSNRPQIDLADFKTPYSIGLGLEINKNDWIIAFSAEYFGKIDPYYVMNDIDDPFDGLLTEAVGETFELTYANKAVINFSIGAQKKVNDKESILMGFRTDFNQRNSFDLNSNLNLTDTNPNVYHVSGGGLFEVKNNFLSLGFDYGIGIRKNGQQLFDSNEVNRENLLEFASDNNVKSTYHSATLFLTYDFILSRFSTMDDEN
ncbi:MAG: hypothetical protein ACI9FN_002247 [Saprospiraceae bacterium]|jgi:hypothetical protein